MPREEMPKQVLVIFDMEFDVATKQGAWSDENWNRANDKLFEIIAKKYEQSGYRMLRFIFWNVCGRTDMISMVNNEEGLCRLSGFSQHVMRIAAIRPRKIHMMHCFRFWILQGMSLSRMP